MVKMGNLKYFRGSKRVVYVYLLFKEPNSNSTYGIESVDHELSGR